MTLGPGLRRAVLSLHLASSVGWIGAVVAYLAIGLSAGAGANAQSVTAAWIAMEVTGWYAIVPLAIASLVTGVVISLGTPWGLFRHYWVIVSLLLTLFCTVILLLHMPDVSASARAIAASGGTATAEQSGHGARSGGHGSMGGLSQLGADLFHPGAGLVFLLAILVLNVYKPRGLTPYGWRKQQEARARQARRATDDATEAAAPATDAGPPDVSAGVEPIAAPHA